MKITQRLNASQMQVIRVLGADPVHVLQEIQRDECFDVVSKAQRALQQIANVREDLAVQCAALDEALYHLGTKV